MSEEQSKTGSIFSVVGHHLLTAMLAFKMSLLKQLEYPLFLVSWMLLIPFQYFAGFWMLKVLANRFGGIAGWTLPELAFLYGLGLLSHAFAITFFIETLRFDQLLLTGGLDRILLRPLNPLFHFCFRQINLIGLIDMIPALVIFLWSCNQLKIQWSAGLIAAVFVSVVGATLIRAGIYLGLASVAFWTKRSSPFVMAGMMFMERTTNYPQHVYPYCLQWLLTFVLPVGFINFYPALYFLKKSSYFFPTVLAPLLTLLVGLCCLGCAAGVFTLGLKRYESAGS